MNSFPLLIRAILTSFSDQFFLFEDGFSRSFLARFRFEDPARYAKTTHSGGMVQSSPSDPKESLSSSVEPLPPNSRVTVPAASSRAMSRRRRALATLPASPVSANKAKADVPVADRDKRCGLSPQKSPSKSGPYMNIAVASNSINTVESIKVGPRSQVGIIPRTMPLAATTELGAPKRTRAFGAIFTLSIFISASSGRPSTYIAITDFRPIMVLFVGLYVSKT